MGRRVAIERLGAAPVDPVPALPRPAAVTQDGKKPRSWVTAAEGIDISKRAERGILDDVLRVVLVAQQVAGERVRIVEMRQYERFEALTLLIWQTSSRAIDRATNGKGPVDRDVIRSVSPSVHRVYQQDARRVQFIPGNCQRSRIGAASASGDRAASERRRSRVDIELEWSIGRRKTRRAAVCSGL